MSERCSECEFGADYVLLCEDCEEPPKLTDFERFQALQASLTALGQMDTRGEIMNAGTLLSAQRSELLELADVLLARKDLTDGMREAIQLFVDLEDPPIAEGELV